MPDPIKIELEKSLALLSDEGRQMLVSRIRPILYINLEKGRITKFIDGQPERVKEYVFRVAEHYEAQNVFMDKIKIERSTDVWEALFSDFQKWAFNYLKRKDFSGTLASEENATDCATEASILILKAHFPFDTDFNPWAHVIVQNACQKFIQTRYKKSSVPDENLENIEDLLEQLKDHHFHESGEQRELNVELRSALDSLPEARRKVITDLYFWGLSTAEISLKMGKSQGAIHSLHFNALHDLKKILNKNRDINNE